MNSSIPVWAGSAILNYRAMFLKEHGHSCSLADFIIFSIMNENIGYADSREESQAILHDMVEIEKGAN